MLMNHKILKQAYAYSVPYKYIMNNIHTFADGCRVTCRFASPSHPHPPPPTPAPLSLSLSLSRARARARPSLFSSRVIPCKRVHSSYTVASALLIVWVQMCFPSDSCVQLVTTVYCRPLSGAVSIPEVDQAPH